MVDGADGKPQAVQPSPQPGRGKPHAANTQRHTTTRTFCAHRCVRRVMRSLRAAFMPAGFLFGATGSTEHIGRT